MNAAPTPLKSHLEAYRRQGVAHLRGMINDDWVRRLREASKRRLMNSKLPGKELAMRGDHGRFHRSDFNAHSDNDIKAFAFESPAASIAGHISESQVIRYFYDMLFVKEPYTSTPTHWHQDLPYLPLRGEQSPSLWLALTAVKRESSGLRCVLGSHLWGRQFRARSPDDLLDRDHLELCPDIERLEENRQVHVLCWDMEPGDMLVVHPLTVHGSGGNRSGTARIALSLRYTGEKITWDPRPRTLRIPGDPRLESGSSLDHDAFPVVWRR